MLVACWVGVLLSSAHVVRDVAVADDRLSEMVLSMRTYVVVRASEASVCWTLLDGWDARIGGGWSTWLFIWIFNRNAHK